MEIDLTPVYVSPITWNFMENVGLEQVLKRNVEFM